MEHPDHSHWMKFVWLSVGLHVAVFLFMVYAPKWRPDRPYIPSVIQVNLVSAPTPGGGAAPETTAVAETPSPRPETVKTTPAPVSPVPSKKPRVSTRPKLKRSLKKKTFKSAKVKKRAIEKVREDLEASKKKSLQEALARIAKAVKNQEAVSANTGGAKRAGGASAGVASGVPASTLLAVYKAEIFSQIQKNWSFSEELAGDKSDLEVLLGMKIMPDGEIREIWFDKRSGNTYLDESAWKAVLKSNPLPPFPQGFQEPYLNQGLRFTPSGLK